MNYAILRTHKLHTLQQIIHTALHNTRHRHTDHTDPNRKHLNRVLLGSDDIAADLMSFYKNKGIETFRKNGVLAVEMVLAFSPCWIKTPNNEYLPDANIKVKNWVKTCLSWAKQRFGDNLLSCAYHGDESSPHLHLILGVSYWDEKRSRFRLSADRFFGSKAKPHTNLSSILPSIYNVYPNQKVFMSIAISKWGNSAALRLPKDLLDRLSLQVGDKVEIRQQGNQIVITPSKPSLEELLSRVTAQNKHHSLVDDIEGRELL